MDQLEVALRKFKAAHEQVEILADGEYFCIRLTNTSFTSGEIQTECGVYISSKTWYFAKTWEEAIKKLKEH